MRSVKPVCPAAWCSTAVDGSDDGVRGLPNFASASPRWADNPSGVQRSGGRSVVPNPGQSRAITRKLRGEPLHERVHLGARRDRAQRRQQEHERPAPAASKASAIP
jgi:hypothetical protein